MTSLATTARPVALQDCNVDLDRIGDGICENSLNILACLYDGGDCCESTCSQDLCEGASDSTCFDPAACENIPTCDLKCEDVSCATPPAPYCQDGLVVTFASEGTCRDGACSYTPTLEACADGTTCTFGACRAAEDTCADLTCDTPSTATCLDDTTLSYADTNPTCADGVCGEVMMTKRCPSGVCSEGACTENAQCSAEAGTLGDGTCQSANNSQLATLTAEIAAHRHAAEAVKRLIPRRAQTRTLLKMMAVQTLPAMHQKKPATLPRMPSFRTSQLSALRVPASISRSPTPALKRGFATTLPVLMSATRARL